MRLALVALLVCVCAGCSTNQQDEPSTDAGTGLTLAEIQKPGAPNYHPCPSTNTNCDTQTVSNTVVVWLDKFDETRDGKSAGTLYIRDLGTNHVYGGIGIYEPNFVPASLDPLPGDVLDFAGPYQEATSIGKAVFNPHTFLPQLYKPVGTFRYEFASDFPTTWTAPQSIQLSDLNENTKATDGNFDHARQYLQMLVTVNDVYVGPGTSAPGGSGARVTYPLGTCAANSCFTTSGPQISNELFDLRSTDYPQGTHLKSVTGIVTWFYSFHIAPRTRDDLVPASSDAGTE
ncbi:MAG TPA: hypothetical protein VF765_08790 [Polyangiaceae bacterium]